MSIEFERPEAETNETVVQILTVYDACAERFLDPFPAPTVAFGRRGFIEAARNEGHQFNKFPEDYTLFHIGEFRPSSGEIVSFPPVSLGVAVQYTGSTETNGVI